MNERWVATLVLLAYAAAAFASPYFLPAGDPVVRGFANVAIFLVGMWAISRLMQWGRLSRDEAVLIAKDAAERDGITWKEPIRTSRSLGKWYVTANAMARGGTIYVVVSATDGAVLSVRVSPR